MQLSGYFLDRLRDDGESIPYRAHPKKTALSSVLLLAPLSNRPCTGAFKKIEPCTH